ncbi:hypothetical protein [Streptacidiphilus sp. MAP12-16]|uniref:hypothetical protein n=1 Tax=Streptacidiphilus sp. MAP12-16 TaxID=3156300 RepID=UPI0035166EB6
MYLLPDKTVNGIGVYRDDVAGLVKTLRYESVDVEFAYPRESRRYLSEYSATPVVATIAVSVSASLTTALVQCIVRIAWARARSAMGGNPPTAEVGSAQITVKIAEIERTDAGTVVRGLEVTGPVGNLEELLRAAVTGPQPGAPVLPEGSPQAPQTGEEAGT